MQKLWKRCNKFRRLGGSAPLPRGRTQTFASSFKNFGEFLFGVEVFWPGVVAAAGSRNRFYFNVEDNSNTDPRSATTLAGENKSQCTVVDRCQRERGPLQGEKMCFSSATACRQGQTKVRSTPKGKENTIKFCFAMAGGSIRYHHLRKEGTNSLPRPVQRLSPSPRSPLCCRRWCARRRPDRSTTGVVRPSVRDKQLRITVPPAAPTSPWYLHSSTCRPHARWLGQLVLASRDALTIPMFCCVHVFGGCRPPNGERPRGPRSAEAGKTAVYALPAILDTLCGVRRQTDCPQGSTCVICLCCGGGSCCRHFTREQDING